MKYNFNSWKRKDLVALLNHSGYSSDDLIDIEYKLTNSHGQAVFEVYYDEIGGGLQTGKVYVSIKNGGLVAEF